MREGEHVSWTPLALEPVVELFRNARFRWWISGGHALDLHVGHSWRQHVDTDVGVCRQDLLRVADLLDGWDLCIASDGKLHTWDPTEPPMQGNNLWCRSSPANDWQLDVTIGDGDKDRWIYRRDRSISRLWDEVVLRSLSGTPYLAPELQLLFKSKSIRDKDQVDAEHVIPLPDGKRMAWLSARADSRCCDLGRAVDVLDEF